MSIPKLVKITTATNLPPEWDDLADTYFQKKAFLDHCEKFNPCHQRYYLLFEEGALMAGAIVYTLHIDLFTFSKVKSPVKMQVIGLPVSVASSGIVGEKKGAEQLIQVLLLKEKGLILCVNLNPKFRVTPGISMPILPNVEMDLKVATWESYTRNLRSSYRRRMKRILEKFENVSEHTTSCSAFSPEHYQLYLAIMKRTPNKLEIIPEALFRNLPAAFRLTTYSVPSSGFYTKNSDDSDDRDKDVILCWHITCLEDARYYFFFGGINYDHIHRYSSYFNNLLGILKESFEQNCTYLDLGQTAEIPKMRLGGKLIPKQMFLYHRNPLVYWILKKLKYFIGYHKEFPEVNVFKKRS